MGALWTDNKDILVMLSDMDINAIAGTLKLYFRELPEPLLTDRLYPAFMEGIGKGWGVGKGMVPWHSSIWHCLLQGGRFPGGLPSSTHMVLTALAGFRPGQGSECCSLGCRQRALWDRTSHSCMCCWEASGHSGSHCCTRCCQPRP